MSLIVVVELTIREGSYDDFQEFEARAVRLMSEFGGKLLFAFQPEDTNDDVEVHVLEFPDKLSFEKYRNDPRTKDMAADRDRVIASTRIMRGLNTNH